MKKFFFSLLALTVLTLTGCAGMAINQGDEAVKMRHYYDAARSYITALSYDGNNAEVKKKLTDIAPQGYDEKLGIARSYESDNNTELAYNHYKELAILIDDLNKYINVSFPVINARAKVIELGNKLSAHYYTEAEKAFYNDDFYTAADKYKKVLSYTSPYKDTTEKLAESYYRQGKTQMYNGNYRQAVTNFEKTTQVIYGYKDARQLAATCKQLADEAEAKVHYTNGLELGGREKYAEAIAEFRNANSLVPHYKNSDELISRYTRMMNEKEAEDHYENGLELSGKGKYVEAISELKQANLSIPHYKNSDELIKTYTRMMNEQEAEDHYENGLELMANENYKEAKGKFEKVITLVGDYKNARKYLNNCKQKLGENTSKEEEKKTTGEKNKKGNTENDNKKED